MIIKWFDLLEFQHNIILYYSTVRLLVTSRIEISEDRILTLQGGETFLNYNCFSKIIEKNDI